MMSNPGAEIRLTSWLDHTKIATKVDITGE